MPSFRSTDGLTVPELTVIALTLVCVALATLPALARRAGAPGDDAAAKSRLIAVASVIERCQLEAPDPASCDTTGDLAAPAERGAGAGRAPAGELAVQILEVGGTTYRIRTRSRSGTSYAIARPPSGPRQRTCDPTGRGGCPQSGAW